ncbi:Talin [Entamoeba marina]
MTQTVLRIHFIFKDNDSPTASVDLIKSIAVLDTDTAAIIVEKALDKLPEKPQGDFILWQPTRHTLFLPQQVLASVGYDKSETLDVRPRMQRFKFELIDKTVKTFQIDVTLTVEKLLEFVGQKVDILYTDEYGLKIYDATSKKESSQWLDPLRVFYEMIDSDHELLIRLKKRFHFRDRNVNDTDQQQLHLLYTDCNNKVIDGYIPFSVDTSIPLVALNCLIMYGPYEDKYAKVDLNSKGFEKKLPEMRKFFPITSQKKVTSKHLLYTIKEWKNKSLTTKTMQAKYQYCQIVMKQKSYGLEMFKVAIRKPGKAKEIPKMFGICKDYVLLSDIDGKNEEVWHIHKIARFAVGKSAFIIDLGNHSTNYITLITEEGELISATLNGYIDLIVKQPEPDFSVNERLEDVPTGTGMNRKKKAVPRVQKGPEQSHVVPQEDAKETVQLCVDKYQQMTFEETDVSAIQFSPEMMCDAMQGMCSTVTDLYSTDQATVENAMQELSKETDVLFSQFCASRNADFGSCVMNADEDDEQLLVACRAATEAAQGLMENRAEHLQSAVLMETAQEIEILPPEMFVLQASTTSVQAIAQKATVNDTGSQMLLHELSRAVGEGIFDLVALANEFNITGEKMVDANKVMITLGKEEIAAMRIIAATSNDDNCQRLMKDMKNTIDTCTSNYLDITKSYGVLEDSNEMQALYDQVGTINAAWDALVAGSQISGIEPNKNLLSMIQNLSAVFNELAQLSDPLVTPQQVEVSIDNLEDILENTKDTCKDIAKDCIDDGNPEQVSVILEDFKDVVDAFFTLRDKLEAGERGELVEDDCIVLRQKMEKLMEGCEMETIGENLQALALNSLAKTAVARRIALSAQVRRAVKNGSIKDKNLRKRLLQESRLMNDKIEEMLKMLALPVDEQGSQLPTLCKEFAPKSYEMIVTVLESIPIVEDSTTRGNLEFACQETERATFDMARLNNLFNNTKQARKDVVLAKKSEFDDIENEIELVMKELEVDDFDVQTVNVDGIRNKARAQIEESIKETPLEDLPVIFDKIQAQTRKNYRACKAMASTSKKSDLRKRLLDASRRLADDMKGVIDLSLDEQYDVIAKKIIELGDVWADMDDVMKEMELDDVIEQQEHKEEEIQDAATKELMGAANKNDYKKEQEDAYNAAVAANNAAAAQQIQKKKSSKFFNEGELSVAILENAQSLINYTSDLISTATTAQKELTGEDKPVEKREVYNKDANWEEGLISAAKTVTGCIQYLVKAANDQVIHNKPSEAMLVACAKSVAANAIQLQTASQVKMNPDNPLHTQLSGTIQKLIQSQNNLVKTVSAGADARQEAPPIKARNQQQLRIMLMEASVNITNIEKELQQAQDELLRMRRARYGKAKNPIPSVSSSTFSGIKQPAVKKTVPATPGRTFGAQPKTASPRVTPQTPGRPFGNQATTSSTPQRGGFLNRSANQSQPPKTGFMAKSNSSTTTPSTTAQPSPGRTGPRPSPRQIPPKQEESGASNELAALLKKRRQME